MSDPIARLNAALEDRYTVERELGKGGMATVYLADDPRGERKVALKVLKPELAFAVEAARFRREIEIVSALRHPNILPLFHWGQVDDLVYYVMPMVEGESLRARIDREGPLPEVQAARYAEEVGEALGYAHSHNVIHRDIKPANILIEAGHAVVADFGVARAISSATDQALTTSGIVIGTVDYMSPEQGAGASSVDGRSDIYGLGCVLYEMLTGEPPFHGRTPQAVIARHVSEPPPSIRVVRPDVSQSIEKAVYRAMAKSPADRFQTAEGFVAALRGEGVDSGDTPPTKSIWRVAGPVVAAAALATSVVLVVGHC